ncbi:MAG TPA: HAD family phosphatase [Planctomycetaceae bacterium]|jgi:HAD superfamily hydrolase (TIGR01549 family)|nr:HAD family phosphatase [Planctomycetaceae bacterium]
MPVRTPSIRTLLIDLGNVLVFFSHEQMCAQIAEVCGAPVADLERLLLEQHLQRRFERGEISEHEFRSALEAEFGRSLDPGALKRAAADIFTLNEPMVPLLDRWKRDGYRLVLLSNTCVTHYEWVREQFDLLDRFDHCVLSYEVGAVKPEDAIFQAALATIDCSPDECFYTDDIADYVARGRSFGLRAEIFRDVPTLTAQLEQLGVNCAR